MSAPTLATELRTALASLPRYSTIDPAAVPAAVAALVADNERGIEAMLDEPGPIGWDGLCARLDDYNDRLNRLWSPIRHLHSVADSEALRAAYAEALPAIVRYGTAQMQNDRLCAAYRSLLDGAGFAQLSPARQQVVRHAVRDFRLGGIELDATKRARFGAVQQRLTELGRQFEEHVLDATRAWHFHTEDASRLAGLPPSLLGLAAQNAAQAGKPGWLLTLDMPCYLPAMTHAEDRALREELYRAYSTRASDQGPNAGHHDNGPLIAEMLALRHELAQLVGFAHYADYSLATKMAPSAAGVIEFLRDLAARSKPHAAREVAELARHAREKLGLDTLEAWDVAYVSEKLRQAAYDISQEALRPYFPAPRVIEGLFGVLRRLFGLDIASVDGVDTWHADVEVFRIADANGRLRGLFYLDLYARPGKRSGAWMDECVVRRRRADGLQYPVAYLTCNFMPPVDGRPSLLTHEEVITLFHEFGHGLHHMLTLIDEAPVSGINGVAWDAVELPSQFLENWCWEREAIDLLSGHHETGEALPAALFERMLAAKGFQAGMKMLRQIEFALFDFRLHAEYTPQLNVQQVLDEVRREVAVLIPPAWNRFQHSFSHIFGGGYAAGYYSYKWAEVLAADAYARFEREGVFNRAVGVDFMTAVLETGGAFDAMTLFRRFRGRDPQPEALLRRSGLLS
ncbi:MAG: M3 family metallopeptidase [Gammaproteobacteria bacterium]